MLVLRLVVEMRNLGIFRWFLDAFASWMRVYMSCIEKVPKMGLFWLSSFLVICHWFILVAILWQSICFWLWGLVWQYGCYCQYGVFVFLSIGIIVLEQ